MATQYNIRDAQGNIYGPATLDVLGQWIREGRILATMELAAEGTDDWRVASTFPELAPLFAAATPVAAMDATPASTSTPATTGGPFATPTVPYAQGTSTNVLAIVSLVASILGIVCCGCFMPSIAGIICGYIGGKQIDASNGAQTGKGLARAGFILGIIGIALSVIGWIIEIIAIAMQHRAGGGGGF